MVKLVHEQMHSSLQNTPQRLRRPPMHMHTHARMHRTHTHTGGWSEVLCGHGCQRYVFLLICYVQIALDKIFRFASSHVFENEVAGLLCADLISAAGKVLCLPSVYCIPTCVVSVLYCESL